MVIVKGFKHLTNSFYPSSELRIVVLKEFSRIRLTVIFNFTILSVIEREIV